MGTPAGSPTSKHRIIRWLAASMLPWLAACAQALPPQPTPTTPADPSPTPAPTPVETRAATAEQPSPVAPSPPPFDLADYANGADIAGLMAEVGEERPYPAQLLPGSPELPEELARELVYDFLDDSRVVTVKQGIRDTRIEIVEDYCDNGTVQIRHIHPQNRFANLGVVGLVGQIRLWSVEHTELTEWNAPYIAGAPDEQRNAYITRGWDALSSKVLAPPTEDGVIRLGSNPSEHIRVFNYSVCKDPQPVLQYRADEWELLGLGPMAVLPDDLRFDRPQLDPDEVVRRWDEIFQNLATFDNLNGHPYLYFCADHRGVKLDRYADNFGEPFTWRIEDGSSVVNNGIWIVYEFDNPSWGLRQEFLYLPDPADAYRAVVAAELTECSVEKGLAYVESIRAEGGQ